jgi:hypothetical protein
VFLQAVSPAMQRSTGNPTTCKQANNKFRKLTSKNIKALAAGFPLGDDFTKDLFPYGTNDDRRVIRDK